MPEIEAILNRRTDLSTFVVHLTRADGERTPLDQLASIYQAHRIEARSPQGWAKAEDVADDPRRQSQRVACFSEVPLEHIHLLTGSITLWGVERRVPLAPYGVALTKLTARRLGVNPVWYVDMTPGREWTISTALNELVAIAVQSGAFHSHPAARILPFIDMMGRWDSRETIKEFSWEREWRHVGDVDLADNGVIWCSAEEGPYAKTRRGLSSWRTKRPVRSRADWPERQGYPIARLLSSESGRSDDVHFRGRRFAVMFSLVVGVLVVFPIVGIGISLPFPWSAIITSTILALFSLLLWRALRVRLSVGPESVRVVNYLRHYELRWSEIEAIEDGGGSIFVPFEDALEFKLRGGRYVLSQASAGARKWRESILDALRPHARHWSIEIKDGLE